MRKVEKLQLVFSEGSLTERCISSVVRKGVSGPGGVGMYWIVKTSLTLFVNKYPPAEYLIIGPGGRGEKLENLEDDENPPVFDTVGLHAMLDLTGRAPDIDSFDWDQVYDFGRGMATICLDPRWTLFPGN
jgi:hypothetical protein